jgi:signal transduction histidine kinase
VRKNIVFITKEAINNVVKYSRATTLFVTLHIEPGIATLCIKDNGIGFEPKLQDGNGIANMKRRAEEIAGEWTLETAPMQGTKICIKIPLQGQQNG